MLGEAKLSAFKLLAKLIAYYAVLAGLVAGVLWLFPGWREFLPVGRIQTLIAAADFSQLPVQGGMAVTHTGSLGPSMIWLVTAVFGALLASLPVSWVYMEIRDPGDYDQSLIDTIVVLPLVVTSIVVVVQHSLALSFSLAGIAGAARFRNNLKSSGDLLFILLAIGMGLSAGIGALELALVTSAAFNFCFVALWSSNYGERAKMKRFLGEFEHPNGHNHHAKADATANASVVTSTTSTTVATEVTETVKRRADNGDDD
jgi:hypothetical protein